MLFNTLRQAKPTALIATRAIKRVTGNYLATFQVWVLANSYLRLTSNTWPKNGQFAAFDVYLKCPPTCVHMGNYELRFGSLVKRSQKGLITTGTTDGKLGNFKLLCTF